LKLFQPQISCGAMFSAHQQLPMQTDNCSEYRKKYSVMCAYELDTLCFIQSLRPLSHKQQDDPS